MLQQQQQQQQNGNSYLQNGLNYQQNGLNYQQQLIGQPMLPNISLTTPLYQQSIINPSNLNPSINDLLLQSIQSNNNVHQSNLLILQLRNTNGIQIANVNQNVLINEDDNESDYINRVYQTIEDDILFVIGQKSCIQRIMTICANDDILIDEDRNFVSFFICMESVKYFKAKYDLNGKMPTVDAKKNRLKLDFFQVIGEIAMLFKVFNPQNPKDLHERLMQKFDHREICLSISELLWTIIFNEKVIIEGIALFSSEGMYIYMNIFIT